MALLYVLTILMWYPQCDIDFQIIKTFILQVECFTMPHLLHIILALRCRTIRLSFNHKCFTSSPGDNLKPWCTRTCVYGPLTAKLLLLQQLQYLVWQPE